MTGRNYPKLGERLYSQQLENGLQICVLPRTGWNQSQAFLAVRCGGADRRFRYAGEFVETPVGTAHYLEHRQFETEEGDALIRLSEQGAWANAFTSADMTAYYFASTSQFEKNLRTLLRFVSVPWFPAEGVERERGIILQELSMESDDPAAMAYYDMLNALFSDHPIRERILGTEESLAQITAETLYRWHRILYTPANMILCAVGDVDPDRIAALAEAELPAAPTQLPVRDYGKPEGAYPVRRRVLRRMETGVPVFCAGAKYALPSLGAARRKKQLTGELALSLLLGRTSPLFARLYGEGALRAEPDMDADVAAGAGFVVLEGESREPEHVLDGFLRDAAALTRDGVDPTALARRKKVLTGQFFRDLNEFDNVCYNMARAYFGGYSYLDTPDVLAEIGAEDVAAFAAECLTPETIALAAVMPQNA